MGNLKDYVTFIGQGKLLKFIIRVNSSVHISLLLEVSKSNTAYEEKLCAGSSPEKVTLQFLWDIDTLKRLNKKGRALLTDIDVFTGPNAAIRS